MATKKTYWNDTWKTVTDFKYFSPVPAPKLVNGLPQKSTEVNCSACQRSFSLSNMGRSVQTSHLKGPTHIKAVERRESTYGIKLFAVSSASQSSKNATSNPTVSRDNADSGGATRAATTREVTAAVVAPGREDPHENPDDPFAIGGAQLPPQPDIPETAGLAGLNKYLVKNDVTKAEIIWCFHIVFNHSSLSAGGKAVQLFPSMFPDSIIAAKMELGRLKMGYTIVHGLAPFFRDKTVRELHAAPYFVAMFDESLNKCSQSTQMDLAVKFWSSETNDVVTKYYDSAFLGRCRSTDLVTAFCEKFPSSLLSRLLLVGMDGPNVNFKFLKDLQVYLKGLHEADDPVLLVMGSCGLHVVHNAFKEGVKATEWNIVCFLRSLYNVFKDVPARRSKYTEWTGSSTFGQKYCAVRWLNNASCADVGIKVLPNLVTFIDKVEKGPKEDRIKSASYLFLVKAVKDKLLGAKLAYFSYVARMVEPFLTAYQTNNPMAPFLYTDLSAILKDLLSLFVKADYLNSCTNIKDVEYENSDNLIPAKEFKFSFSVKEALRKVEKVTAKEMLEFKQDCILLLQKMIKKISDKSPLPYKLCKSVTFADPELIVKSDSAALARLCSCLTILQERNWFGASDCDAMEKDFKNLITKPAFKVAASEYDRKGTRLDHFWRKICVNMKCSSLLTNLLKLVLTISHGNAFVERGFSINKKIVVENQLSSSLVAQRQVYDALNLAGGIHNIVISDKMISRVRHARSEWEEERKSRNKESKEKEQKRKASLLIGQEVKELQAKKRKLLIDNQLELDAIDERLNALTKS